MSNRPTSRSKSKKKLGQIKRPKLIRNQFTNEHLKPERISSSLDPNFKATFGTSLKELMDYEKTIYPYKDVPLIVQKCLDYLVVKGLHSEGIFRVPGADNVLRLIVDTLDSGSGHTVDFFKSSPCHVEPSDVASLLKKYLRELPEPLLTNDLSDHLKSVMDVADETARIIAFCNYFERLPEDNRNLVKKLTFFLVQVSTNASINLMNVKNLATIFGKMSSIFAPESDILVSWMINNYSNLFEETVLSQAIDPTFQRKLVGHKSSVIGMVKDGDNMWSFDTHGNVQIRKINAFEFVRQLNLGFRLSRLPIIHNSKLWVAVGDFVQIWKVEEFLDLNIPNPEKNFQKINYPSILGSIVSCNDEVWVAGETLTLLTKNMWKKDLLEKDSQKIITAMSVIGEEVWLLKGHDLQIWNNIEYCIKEEIKDIAHIVSSIVEINDDVWLPGSDVVTGEIVVISKYNYEVTHRLKEHTATVYHVALIGDLVWSVAWDLTISTYTASTKQLLKTIPNTHIDAISWIVPVWQPDINGWQVWTASYDQTIDIIYVPKNYDKDPNSRWWINNKKIKYANKGQIQMGKKAGVKDESDDSEDNEINVRSSPQKTFLAKSQEPMSQFKLDSLKSPLTKSHDIQTQRILPTKPQDHTNKIEKLPMKPQDTHMNNVERLPQDQHFNKAEKLPVKPQEQFKPIIKSKERKHIPSELSFRSQSSPVIDVKNSLPEISGHAHNPIQKSPSIIRGKIKRINKKQHAVPRKVDKQDY